MDVKSAVLDGYINEEVYTTQPYGLKVPFKEHLIYMLNKALYGLK